MCNKIRNISHFNKFHFFSTILNIPFTTQSILFSLNYYLTVNLIIFATMEWNYIISVWLLTWLILIFSSIFNNFTTHYNLFLVQFPSPKSARKSYIHFHISIQYNFFANMISVKYYNILHWHFWNSIHQFCHLIRYCAWLPHEFDNYDIGYCIKIEFYWATVECWMSRKLKMPATCQYRIQHSHIL